MVYQDRRRVGAMLRKAVQAMNDEDIKKELEQHIRIANYVDLIFCDCVSVDLLQKTIDCINRQQAEIERLKEFIAEIARSDRELKSEAIKEFAEKLKKRQRTFIDEEYAYEFIPSIEIDVLLAEKVGEQNA